MHSEAVPLNARGLFHSYPLRSVASSPGTALGIIIVACPSVMLPQSVPPALVSPPAGPPRIGPNGEKFIGMPKFHVLAPYDINEGYSQIFDGKTFTGRDADLAETTTSRQQPAGLPPYDLKFMMTGPQRISGSPSTRGRQPHRTVVLRTHDAGHPRLSRSGDPGAAGTDQPPCRRHRR